MGKSKKENQEEILIETEELKKYYEQKSFFGRKKQIIRAVDGVNVKIPMGKTYGLVGESGCGKSTLGSTILQMDKATSGKILYKGADITGYTNKELYKYKRKMQIIYQDPYTALNPYMTVEELIEEPMNQHLKLSQHEKKDYIEELLVNVGMSIEDLSKFSYEFSGGQRQRIGIARALSVRPEFIVCDEPVSALDVSIQAQVINMLQDVQDKYQLTYLFIAHDLSVIRFISDQIGVMYLGNLVETADVEELYHHPLHPYTVALLDSMLKADPKEARRRKLVSIEGEAVGGMSLINGCKFVSRCPYSEEKCRREKPHLKVVHQNHAVMCHKY